MNLYAVLPFISGIIFFIFGLFIFSKNTKSKLNLFYFLTCFSAAVWVIGYSFMYASNDEAKALFYARIGYIGVVFIPTFLYNFIKTFLQLKRNKLIILAIYLTSIFFLFADGTNYFLNGMHKYFWGFYPKVGFLYIFYVIFFAAVFARCSWLLFKKLIKSDISPAVSNQIKYVLLAFLVGMTSLVDYIQNYGIEIYPWGYISALGWIILMAVAIFRYRLMDINLALARGTIFIAVYTPILATPFIIGSFYKSYLMSLLGDRWWVVPPAISTFLATTGPFIYMFLQRRAEARLLKEQRRYQQTLRDASTGMILVKDLNKLLSLIVHILTKAVRIDHASIYLYDKDTDHYVLRATRGSGFKPGEEKFDKKSPLIEWLCNRKDVLLSEEVSQWIQEKAYPDLDKLLHQMKKFKAEIVVPSFVRDELFGFLVMGNKLSGETYSQDDINVFQVLANQAALAIENAMFYEDLKRTQAELFQTAKMASLGSMASGMSHQINNRFNILTTIAGDVSLRIFESLKKTQLDDNQRKMVDEAENSVNRIEQNALQGGDIVRTLLRFSKPSKEGYKPLTLRQIVNNAIEVVRFGIHLDEVDLGIRIPDDLPVVKGDLNQLSDCFFNLINNSFDAIKTKEEQLQLQNYSGKIEISASHLKEDGFIEIKVTDNGTGVSKKDLDQLFIPFFTTKATAQKGHGLGLFVIKKIIETHGGRIDIESRLGEYTAFLIKLPVMRQEESVEEKHD